MSGTTGLSPPPSTQQPPKPLQRFGVNQVFDVCETNFKERAKRVGILYEQNARLLKRLNELMTEEYTYCREMYSPSQEQLITWRETPLAKEIIEWIDERIEQAREDLSAEFDPTRLSSEISPIREAEIDFHLSRLHPSKNIIMNPNELSPLDQFLKKHGQESSQPQPPKSQAIIESNQTNSSNNTHSPAGDSLSGSGGDSLSHEPNHSDNVPSSLVSAPSLTGTSPKNSNVEQVIMVSTVMPDPTLGTFIITLEIQEPGNDGKEKTVTRMFRVTAANVSNSETRKELQSMLQKILAVNKAALNSNAFIKITDDGKLDVIRNTGNSGEAESNSLLQKPINYDYNTSTSSFFRCFSLENYQQYRSPRPNVNSGGVNSSSAPSSKPVESTTPTSTHRPNSPASPLNQSTQPHVVIQPRKNNNGSNAATQAQFTVKIQSPGNKSDPVTNGDTSSDNSPAQAKPPKVESPQQTSQKATPPQTPNRVLEENAQAPRVVGFTFSDLQNNLQAQTKAGIWSPPLHQSPPAPQFVSQSVEPTIPVSAPASTNAKIQVQVISGTLTQSELFRSSNRCTVIAAHAALSMLTDPSAFDSARVDSIITEGDKEYSKVIGWLHTKYGELQTKEDRDTFLQQHPYLYFKRDGQIDTSIANENTTLHWQSFYEYFKLLLNSDKTSFIDQNSETTFNVIAGQFTEILKKMQENQAAIITFNNLTYSVAYVKEKISLFDSHGNLDHPLTKIDYDKTYNAKGALFSFDSIDDLARFIALKALEHQNSDSDWEWRGASIDFVSRVEN